MLIVSTDNIIAEIASEMDLRFSEASGAVLSVLSVEEDEDFDD